MAFLLTGCAAENKSQINTNVQFKTEQTAEKSESQKKQNPFDDIFVATTEDTEYSEIPGLEVNANDQVSDLQLKPTNSNYNKLSEQQKKEFEKPATKIKSKDIELDLGKLQIQKVKYFYHVKNNTLKIEGQYSVQHSKDNSTTSSQFLLIGKRDHFSNKANLYELTNSNTNSKIRAVVTCMGVDEQDQISCGSSIIDFFVEENGKYYTHQLEIIEKIIPAKIPPVVNSPKTDTDTTEPEEEAEGDVEAIDDRYETTTQDVNVKELLNETPKKYNFETGEEESTPSPVDPKKPTDSKKEPPKSAGDTTKPAAPQISISQDLKDLGKVIDANYFQLKDGTVRQYNQAIGLPERGKLRNPTILKNHKQSGNLFVIVNPQRQRYYATQDLVDMIQKLGLYLNKESQHKLFVGNISAIKGGRLPPHKSHQIGMDVDLGYPTYKNDITFPIVVKNGKLNKSAYSVEKTYSLFKEAFKSASPVAEKIFVDKLIIKDLCQYAQGKNEFKGHEKTLAEKVFNNLTHVTGHGNHFHLRVKCNAFQPNCRSKIYKMTKNCAAL